MKILKATYGSSDCVLDVTDRLQMLVKNGHLSVRVSNSHFADPCPRKVKILHFAYELPGSDRFYTQQTEEHRLAIAPIRGGDRIGIFYTNNAVPPKYLQRVFGQLKKVAGNVDIITCPWHPIEGNPFPEVRWTVFHVPHYLTITLQILRLLHLAEELGKYRYVFFLEHDVLYPEGYFDIEPFSEDVLYNNNYIGLSENGFQTAPPNLFSLHLLAMKLPAAIEHFTSTVRRAIMEPEMVLEPRGRSRKTRRTLEPVVHINHGTHFSQYTTFFSEEKSERAHPYWGSATSWWD